MPYQPTIHSFEEPPELTGARSRYPVVIVGGGPVGMAMALDLAHRGVRSVVLERGDTVGVGSKAICWAKRTLEVFDRLGCGPRLLAKGVVWNTGKVFLGDDPDPIYQFDLLPEQGHEYPAFINLQQYYVEEYLAEALAAEPMSEMRWQSEAVRVEPHSDGVRIWVSTPAGAYPLDAEYLVAADGSRSAVRRMLGLEFVGRVFKDHFLIADLKMPGEFPAERRFWFDPPFNRGWSALLHKQPDDVWRTDFQLGWDIDREEELKEDNVTRRVRAMLGEDRDFSFEWISIYTFECRRLERFVHGRVVFVGDAAHVVSPFGARGCNGGIQDIDNLGWKLERVLSGTSPRTLLETYDVERIHGADENILNSSRATDFMTPKSGYSTALRDAVLDLSREYPFARSMVNSGRLSVPCVLTESPLNTPDAEPFGGRMVPGAPCLDAPVRCQGREDWLLHHLGGDFTVLRFADSSAQGMAMLAAEGQTGGAGNSTAKTIVVTRGETAGTEARVLSDPTGLVSDRYDARGGTTYLVRPDQHVVGRWRRFDASDIERALRRATGND